MNSLRDLWLKQYAIENLKYASRITYEWFNIAYNSGRYDFPFNERKFIDVELTEFLFNLHYKQIWDFKWIKSIIN